MEKRGKFLDFATKLKQLLNMKVTVISIVIGSFGTIPKDFVTRLGELEIRRL